MQGGSASTICEARNLRSGTVSNDGSTVVYDTAGIRSGFWEVSFAGGTPKPALSPAEKEEIFSEFFGGAEVALGRFPSFLPSEAGERVLLFGVGPRLSPTRWMMVLDMETRRREVLPPGIEPAYSPTGHLVYSQGLNPVSLWALPFSLSTLQPEGEPFLIRRNAQTPTLARDGTLVYLDWVANPNELVWRDRKGDKLGSIGPGEHPEIAPDGSRVAFHLYGDIWVYDLNRGTPTKVTAEQAGDFRPVWFPDGKRLVFGSLRMGSIDIWISELDRVGEPPEPLFSSPDAESPQDWTPNGEHLIYQGAGHETGSDLFFLKREEPASEWKSHVFLQSDHVENEATLSPDGRWVAYQRYVSGRAEIYVERFPGGGQQVIVSTNEGRIAHWRADGKELFYLGGQGKTPALFAVRVLTEPDFSVLGQPVKLFDLRGRYRYDVSPDGQRFLFSERPEETRELAIQVVENWYEEFRDRQQD